MRQLTKTELLEIPDGCWRGHIRLSLIPEQGPPIPYLGTTWTVKFEKVGSMTAVAPMNLTWMPYTLETDCSDSGDLVFEDYLMQFFAK